MRDHHFAEMRNMVPPSAISLKSPKWSAPGVVWTVLLHIGSFALPLSPVGLRLQNKMQWVASPEKDTAGSMLEKRLWDAADQFRANSGLKPQEYSPPVLGLIFLRFAEVRFSAQRAKLEKSAASSPRGSRLDDPAASHADGMLYLALAKNAAEILET
jgi:hypothetical protein